MNSVPKVLAPAKFHTGRARKDSTKWTGSCMMSVRWWVLCRPSRPKDGQGQERAQPVGWEVISICLLKPILPLTNFVWLCLCGLFSTRDCELMEGRSGAWQIVSINWNLLPPHAQLKRLLVGWFHLSGIILESLLLLTHNRVAFYSGVRLWSQGLRQTELSLTLKSSELPVKLQCVWFCVCNPVL